MHIQEKVICQMKCDYYVGLYAVICQYRNLNIQENVKLRYFMTYINQEPVEFAIAHFNLKVRFNAFISLPKRYEKSYIFQHDSPPIIISYG